MLKWTGVVELYFWVCKIKYIIIIVIRLEYLLIAILYFISESSLQHPFGLDVFKSNVFWTDWESYNIESAHKSTGE